jgi:membrane protein required for colicin V production
MDLNMFDIVVVSLLLFLSLKGLLNGFFKELFYAIGFIGGIFVASNFHNDVAQFLQQNGLGLDIKILNLLSLIAIFFLFLIVFIIIARFVTKVDSFSFVSRLLGMLTKAATMFIIFSLIVFAFSTKPKALKRFQNIIDSSKLYPILRDMGATILNMPVTKIEITKESNSSKSDKNISKENLKDVNLTTKENNQTQNITIEHNKSETLDQNLSEHK